MTIYQKFKQLKLDTSAIGLLVHDLDVKHFCTPKGARLIGWAGVDGIHYCFVRGQGETVFAVSPMNDVGQNVFPIARTFEDLLRLLLACGDLAALEQAHQWDEEQFEEFLAENGPTPAAQAVFDVLRSKLGIIPMEEPFTYIRNLQDGFNYGELDFFQEYYEALWAVSPEDPPRQWRVTLDGDLLGRRGKAGKEISLNAQFTWGDETWFVPAVYLFSGGIVLDLCIQVSEPRIRTFYDKYLPLQNQEITLSDAEQNRLQQENPVNVRFTPSVDCNGETLRRGHGRGVTWVSEALVGSDSWTDPEAQRMLDHYGLDKEKPWVLRRHAFLWEGRRQIQLEQLRLHLEREKQSIPVLCFETPQTGHHVTFRHPITNETHTLTVQVLEPQALDPDRFHDKTLIFPTHFTAMTFTLDPDLPHDAFSLSDLDHGDNPRPRNPDPHGRFAMSVGAVAMMRRIDPSEPGHTICSNLHFEPTTEPIHWSLSVRNKPLDDIDLKLI